MPHPCQLSSYIAPAAPATRRLSTGNEAFLRPEIGFTPNWYHLQLGIDFGKRWHTEPEYRRDTILVMKNELKRRFPESEIGELRQTDSALDILTGTFGACTIAGIYRMPILYAQDNWLANNQIRGFIKKMKARHIALVSDSCFSGDILNPSRGLVSGITDEYFKNAYNRVSRQVLTSGASETVPDVSPFAQQLKFALEGNNKPYLDPLMIYNEIRLGVSGTTPLFGNLKGSGHQEGASFIFFLKEEVAEVQETIVLTTEEPELRITLEKTYGSLKVEVKTSGDLYIDGKYQGKRVMGSSQRA